MPAGKKNLLIEQGTTWDPVFELVNADGTPKDLTGATARLQVRKDLDSAAKIVELSSAGGGASPSGTVTINGPAGKISALVTDETLETIAHTAFTDESGGVNPAGPFSGVWDLEVEFADGVTRRILEGKIKFRREVTR